MRLPDVYGRSGNANDGPRKLWAANCLALHDYLPKTNKAVDGLMITNGTDPNRGVVLKDWPEWAVRADLAKLRDIGPSPQEQRRKTKDKNAAVCAGKTRTAKASNIPVAKTNVGVSEQMTKAERAAMCAEELEWPLSPEHMNDEM